MVRLFLATALLLAAVEATHAQQPAASPLAAAAFMTGCWRGAAGPNQVIEEIYFAPSGNLMQGVSRFLRGDRTVDFEFSLLDVDHDRIRLRPHPRGKPSVEFAQKELSEGRIVWENPAHDFPQRIMYTKAAGDSLIARIEGTTPQGDRFMEWRMARVACPGV